MNDGWGISCEIALIWMSVDFTDDQSTLVQVMAWCRQATSHYLGQCWPRSLMPYGVTRPQFAKKKTHSNSISQRCVYPHCERTCRTLVELWSNESNMFYRRTPNSACFYPECRTQCFGESPSAQVCGQEYHIFQMEIYVLHQGQSEKPEFVHCFQTYTW